MHIRSRLLLLTGGVTAALVAACSSTGTAPTTANDLLLEASAKVAGAGTASIQGTVGWDSCVTATPTVYDTIHLANYDSIFVAPGQTTCALVPVPGYVLSLYQYGNSTDSLPNADTPSVNLNSGKLLATDTTGSSGQYSFTGLSTRTFYSVTSAVNGGNAFYDTASVSTVNIPVPEPGTGSPPDSTP